MTAAEPLPEVRLCESDPADGCVDCGVPETLQLHPYRGRLCPAHAVLPTLPAGDYRRELAEDLVDLGRADRAFDYLALYLSRTVEARFDAIRGGA